MATLTQFLNYIDLDPKAYASYIQEIKDEVKLNGPGTYCYEFSRGDINFGWMSEANDINDIYSDNEDYFSDFTSAEDLDLGIVNGEETMFVQISSVD